MTRIPLPDDLAAALAATAGLERAYVVGGFLRDRLLGIDSKDVDIEVYGLSLDELARRLAVAGKVDLVGRSFGIVKWTLPSGSTYDVSIPRRDSKVGIGHRGFEVLFDPEMAPREAAARRDFTINALMQDLATGELLDFFGGREDLERRVLRHVGPAFVEDPLRVLRAMQFTARFDLAVAPETLALCREMVGAFGELSPERVREEWFKWAAQATVPSRGLRFLADCGWLAHFPEIAALAATPQDPEWHPEGDVFVHTGHCLDRLVELAEWRAADRESRIVYALAVLAHDFGKPETTHRELKRGVMRIVSPGHEAAGVARAEQFLARIDAPQAIVRRVGPLVREHLVGMQEMTPRAVRRLARRLAPENIEGLALVMTADAMGRPPLPPVVPPHVTALLEAAHREQVAAAAPVPLMLGRHLVELGLAPGPAIGALLERVYDAQLDGAFTDLAGARAWLLAHDDGRLDGEARQRLADRVAAGG
jgi:tRNA nucleotidyltransferase (CCA-adding enzyme)